jgi:hypothetical protein
MNMLAAMAAPDFRDGYRERTLAMNDSSQSEVRIVAALERAQGVERAWEKTSIAARNLVLRDALMLLSSKGAARADWNFVQTDDLRKQFSVVKEHVKSLSMTQAAEQALQVLDRLVSKAKEETYPSYELFFEGQSAFNPAQTKDGDEALQRYELWLRKYRPYVVLDLPLDVEYPDSKSEAELAKRMKFFLSKNPEPQFEEHYMDRMWAYVYQVKGLMGVGDAKAAVAA